MFSLGMLEILVIAGLAVLLFPPRELPKLARGIARVYGTIRHTADEFKRALLQDEELREPFEDVKKVYDQTRWDVRRIEQDARRELAKAQLEARIRAGAEQAAGRRVSHSGPREGDGSDSAQAGMDEATRDELGAGGPQPASTPPPVDDAEGRRREGVG